MIPLELLEDPYRYVYTESVVSGAVELLKLDRSLSGTEPSSVYVTRQELPKNGLLALRGLGKHLWDGIDAQDYIDNLRDEWKE